MLHDLLFRLRSLFRRKKLEAELDDELRIHFDRQIEKHLSSGLSREEATRRARLQLGGFEQLKEDCREARGIGLFENFVQDTRYGWRTLRKNPGFTLIAVLTLALGIGATTSIFSVVNTVLLSYLPYKNPSRLVMVWGTNAHRGVNKTPVSPGDFFEWKRRNTVFQDIAASYDNEMTLTGVGNPQLLIGYSFSANYFSILAVAPETGRTFSSDEDRPGGPRVTVLSDKLWRDRFDADAMILGQTITLDGEPYSVIGVMPRGFDYPPGTEPWLPVALSPSDAGDFQHHYIRVMGRLKPRVTVAQAQNQMTTLSRQLAAEHVATDAGNGVNITPLRRQLAGDIQTPLYVLLGAVVFVLLIACANVASLLLARASARHREIAARAALGATRGRLLRQFLTESLLLCLAGGALGVLLAFLCTKFLVSIFPNNIANLSIPGIESIPISMPVLFFALGATLFTGLLFGVLPALRAARADAAEVLKESSRGGTGLRTAYLRRVLIIAEIALSIVLLAGAGLLIQSFENVTNASLGFHPGHMLGLQLLLPGNRYPRNAPDKQRAFVRGVLREMRALPGVESAAAISTLPLTGFWGQTDFFCRRAASGETR